MTWRAQIDEFGRYTRYKDSDTGEVISSQEYEKRMQMQHGGYSMSGPGFSNGMQGTPVIGAPVYSGGMDPSAMAGQMAPQAMPAVPGMAAPGMAVPGMQGMPPQAAGSPLIMPGAQMVGANGAIPQPAPAPQPMAAQPQAQPPSPGTVGHPSLLAAGGMPGHGSLLTQPGSVPVGGGAGGPAGFNLNNPSQAMVPTAGQAVQGKNLRMEGVPTHQNGTSYGRKPHGFLDATSIAILLPTLVLLALIIAAAHKKRLFPWQTIRTFNPPSGLMTPRDYERSFVCPPNLRRHGRIGKRNPNATWGDQDGVVLPFGFLARTHLPVTIPMGRLPNKNMFLVAPSGSGKTTLMRAIIKALLAKPCVIIALEAKANDPNLDEKREGFKYSLLPEAQHAGFDTLYFNPLDSESIHWNPLDLDPISFASSIVQDVNSLPPEEQHWAERDHGYIYGLAQLLKWGAVQVSGEDENGSPSDVQALPCNPRGLMRLVNNRRNIVESLRRLKNNPDVDAAELSELTQTLSSIIRTDTDWDKNIQGVRGRLRMFKNPGVLRVTERSNVDIKASMHRPTVLIFGAPASLGPDAESLASCFVYQLQQALHTRYGTASVLPLFAFFDEYQTLNMDIAGRLSAIVRGANGGLTVILQNVSQIATSKVTGTESGGSGTSELRTIFSNSAIRVCLHNADETTAKFFSEEIGKHAVVVPGISDHYQSTGFGIFPSSWNRIHSQQVVARVDPDSIKRMEKQHALVYLSPAGDAEFGENKPMMVDLRGIEEIARLHLLHNVSARKTPPQGAMPAPGAPIPAMPPFATGDGAPPVSGGPEQNIPQGGVPENFGTTQMPALAPGVANSIRVCPSCGKEAGKRKFCIECGHFLGAAEAPAAPAAVEMQTSAQIINTEMPQMDMVPVSATSAPPFPTFARPQTSTIGNIEQGIREAGAPAPASPLVKSTLLESPAQIAQSFGTTYDAPPPEDNPYQRRPVTSFTPDTTKFGFMKGNPPAGASGKSGVEF